MLFSCLLCKRIVATGGIATILEEKCFLFGLTHSVGFPTKGSFLIISVLFSPAHYRWIRAWIQKSPCFGEWQSNLWCSKHFRIVEQAMNFAFCDRCQPCSLKESPCQCLCISKKGVSGCFVIFSWAFKQMKVWFCRQKVACCLFLAMVEYMVHSNMQCCLISPF